MTVTKITTHVADAKKRLISPFQNKERVKGIVEVQANRIQTLEDAAFALIEGRSIQKATGAALDRWGVVLNETRGLKTEAEFRTSLFFKIQRNITNGTPEEMINILRDLVQGTAVQYEERYPGAVRMTVVGAQTDVDPDFVLSQIRLLSPAGVRTLMIAIGYSPNPFAFLGHPNEDARGFDTFPVQEIGGQLVSQLEP